MAIKSEMNCMDLQIVQKEYMSVKPCKASRRQIIDLSGLDRISPAMLYTIFFYKCEEDGSEMRLKRSMEEVLVEWYPAAGRLRVNEETKKLEIECNDEGVVMVTSVTHTKLEEIGTLHQYKPCYENLVPHLPHPQHISQKPLLVVQITRFGCGGYSIGFGGSHALFDGMGAFNFLASWARMSNNKLLQDPHHHLLPNHSRDALLHAISSSAPSSSIYEQNHIAGIQDLYGIPMQAMASDDTCWETALARLCQGNILRLVTLCMEKQMVEAWKGAALQTGNLSKCSTFDVLCAHVWKARVKSLDLEANTKICLQFPVDARTKLQTPLGHNFTGNAFVLGSVSCIVKDLLQEPLHNTIHKIQSSKAAITDEYIKLYVKALESPDKFFPSMRELTIVTDWLKFPFHALDFGNGKVASAALLATPVPETAFLMPNLDDPAGGFLVRIGIEEKYVQDLIINFNKFGY